MLLEKFETAFWFFRRPGHWAQGVELAKRKLRDDMDGPEAVSSATQWAKERAVPVMDALRTLGVCDEAAVQPIIEKSVITAGAQKARQSKVQMGGAGDLDLLYAAVKLTNSQRVIETGVAYGWSSLAILTALEGRENAKLVSVDMPYPKMNNENFVGIVVPEMLRNNWVLVRRPDRKGLEVAIKKQGVSIDLCHYDSDKSWWGRQYGFPLLWDALKDGGVFISDDIQDNMAFADFVEKKGAKFAVTESDGKYIGIIKK